MGFIHAVVYYFLASNSSDSNSLELQVEAIRKVLKDGDHREAYSKVGTSGDSPDLKLYPYIVT